MSVIDDSWRKTNKDSLSNIYGWRTGAHKKSLNNSWPYLEMMHAADPKSKSGSRSLEMANYPVRMLHAPSGRPWPWRRNLQHFFKSILFQCPSTWAELPGKRADDYENSSERAGIEKFSRRWLPHLLSQPRKLLMWKHQQRCYEFYTSWKRTTWKDSQQLTSPGSAIPIFILPQKCLHHVWQMSFQGRGRPSGRGKLW
jgi:hypothetical protein